MAHSGVTRMANGRDALPDVKPSEVKREVKREDFDKDFVFGAATSAYQIEGAFAQDGKGPSAWDAYANTRPEKISDGKNANVAADQYHLFEEDVKLMTKVGLDAYRFSISWVRILPGAKLSAGINKAGIKYYNDLINKVLAEGLQPYVTLFHWDLPLALEHEYGGFLSDSILNDFVDFAELCFWEFGDRVKHWITMNEAWSYVTYGYAYGGTPPGRDASDPQEHVTLHHYKGVAVAHACPNGNPGTEPYIVAHNMILSHAHYC